MKIFNIFNISEPFKTGVAGNVLGVPYTIQYNMSAMGTELDGTRYIRNYGKGGNSFNAEAFASNHVSLNETPDTGQSADLDTIINGFLTYFDVSTKAQETVSTPSASHTMNKSFSSAFATAISPIQSDRDYLNANPDELARVWEGDNNAGLSFTNANMVHYYPCTEKDSAYIQDVGIDLGDEETINGGFDTDTDWALTSSTIANSQLTLGGTATQSIAFKVDTKYVFIIDIESSTAPATKINLEGAGTGSKEILSVAGAGVIPIVYHNADAETLFKLQVFSGQTIVNSISCKEVSASEIIAYIQRLTNTSYGASNLAITLDGSDRMTGITPANTTQWEADGRTAVANWTITAPFTITEPIDGDTYTFTSAGNRYKNTVADGTYTLPTGVWTLDEFGFDGVTSVTARGVTRMIDEVVIP